MSTNALASLEYDATTAKRAQYEGFEFTIEAPGCVRVTNAGYGDEKNDHSYTVIVADGVPTECTCPSDEHRPGACKHRVAVAIRTPIMDVAAGTLVRTDGGAVLPPETRGGSPEDTAPAGCPHDPPDCEGADADTERPVLCFDCWEAWA